MTIFKVYWSDIKGQACSKDFDNMKLALNCTQELRNTNHQFVSMVSENTEQVGRLGVAAVVDGLLPNGKLYTWKKRRI